MGIISSDDTMDPIVSIAGDILRNLAGGEFRPESICDFTGS